MRFCSSSFQLISSNPDSELLASLFILVLAACFSTFRSISIGQLVSLFEASAHIIFTFSHLTSLPISSKYLHIF